MPRFSLASEIVELVVLTADDAFLQTLREAVAGSRRLWHVVSGDKVGDLLIAGQVGILVLDVQALHEDAGVFVSQIKRQFPDLVIVVAGNRNAEAGLAAQISAGMIYRFIHKPMSPNRARLFADAAVKKYAEQRHRIGSAHAVRVKPAQRRGLLFGGAVAAAAVAVAASWMLQSSGRNGRARWETLHEPGVESPLLARAAAALAANRLTAPPGDNALELYRQELQHAPNEPGARAGLLEVQERLSSRAENALLEERLDAAASAIAVAASAGVDAGRIAFLDAQLTKARSLSKAAQAQARQRSDAAASDARLTEDRVAQALSLAAERTQEERLVSPPNDSARYYVEQALRVDPKSAVAEEAEQSLALRLLTEARSAIERRDFARAASLLLAAHGIAAAPNIENLEQMLKSAQQNDPGE